MTPPSIYNLKAFLGNLSTRSVPEISAACSRQIQALAHTGPENREFIEYLKEMILLLRHLRQPAIARDPEVHAFLTDFLTRVLEHDRRAKHALAVLQKQPAGTGL